MMVKMVKNGPKWLKMAENGQKWLKVVKKRLKKG